MDIYNDDYILATGTSNGTEQESLDKEKDDRPQAAPDLPARGRAPGVKMLFGTDAGVYPHGENAQPVRQDGAMGNDPAPGDPGGDQQRLRGARPQRCRHRSRPAATATSSRSRGDPLRDVTLLEHVDAVIKGGVLVKGRWRAAVSAPTTSTRTLVIALAREPRHCRVQVRRRGDHRLVGDADRRRPQRRRFDQPAAADVGPARRRRSRPTASSVRLRPRALFLELRRRRAGVLARRRRVDLRRHHPHRRSRSRRCRR